MLWLDKYKGFLADVPNITFVRCDGTAFSYDALSSASMTHNHNTITITGGQGAFPLAYIDTDSTLEFQFESAEFNLDIFEMANAVTIEEGDFGAYESRRCAVETGLKINLPFEVKDGSVIIRGMQLGESVAAGKYTVAITASAADTAGKTVITFNTGDVAVGDEVRVVYQRRIIGAAKVPVKTTSTAAKGSLFADWPIYSDGANCADAAIKGILHMIIYRCRVTAMPGFNNSYKGASTNGLTFAAMDARRADKKMFDIIYEPMSATGEIVNYSSVSAGAVGWVTDLTK